MTKATLEFDLNDPDDAANHLRAINARRLCMAINDFDRWLRQQIKFHDGDGVEALNVVREAFNECLYDNAINMDELLR